MREGEFAVFFKAPGFAQNQKLLLNPTDTLAEVKCLAQGKTKIRRGDQRFFLLRGDGDMEGEEMTDEDTSLIAYGVEHESVIRVAVRGFGGGKRGSSSGPAKKGRSDPDADEMNLDDGNVTLLARDMNVHLDYLAMKNDFHKALSLKSRASSTAASI